MEKQVKAAMAVYRISLGISEGEYDYQSLWNRLKELGALQILPTEWLIVKTNDPYTPLAGAIAVNLRKHLITGDALLVQEVGRDLSWYNLPGDKDAVTVILRDSRF